MKTIKVDLPRTLKAIELHVMADTHIGDAHCDMKRVEAMIKRIAETPNAYTIVNGDIINNAVKSSVSDVYSETLSPMQQIERATEILKPIAHKIIGIHTGNHCARTYRESGVDIMAIVARELGAEYTPEGGLYFVRFGRASCGKHETRGDNVRRVCYTIYAIHGSGGGRTTGAKANKLHNLSDIVDADVYFRAHAHEPIAFKQDYYRVDYPNSAVKRITKLYVNTAAALDYGGYAQQHEYAPACLESPVVILDGTKKHTRAIV